MIAIGRGLLYFLSIGVAGYALIAYLFFPLGALVHPEMKVNFEANRIGIYLHIFASAIALTVGPFQLSTNFRKKHINLHRWFGRLYLVVGVLIGGLALLYAKKYSLALMLPTCSLIDGLNPQFHFFSS